MSALGLLFLMGGVIASPPPSLVNPTAYVPPQCYAVTRESARTRTRTRNGCFACHQTPRAPNFTDDAEVQTTLSFARAATENRWANALKPLAPAAISDADLLRWVRRSNYAPGLAGGAFVPDCHFRFDERGLDRAPDGRMTGWRAYRSTPFPGMFWPTNGSAGDVMIRLPAAFRTDESGRESEAIYVVNLAILEAMIRRTTVALAEPADERALGVDLDGDGVLAVARRVAFEWPPRPGRALSYVGAAAKLDRARDGWPAAGLFPRGTELLHSLRYFDVVDGEVRMAARMKELRYARKVRWSTYAELEAAAQAEVREKQKRPDATRRIDGDAARGVGTGGGWVLAGFIEDARGALRPQTVEETAYCVGCHGGVGATTDGVFSFPRKLGPETFQGGWAHPTQRGLDGVPEPRRADGEGEYARWLAEVGGGDDFLVNQEVAARFFRRDGALRPEALRALARDIATLVMPSPRRALALDRAALGLARAQAYTSGRELLVGAPPRIHARRPEDGPTGIDRPVPPAWMARPLDRPRRANYE